MSSVEFTRSNIKSAFWDLYEKKRLEQITVSEICKKAGYNRSTFYDYYSDIYAVLDEIESEIITPSDFQELILNNVIFGTSREEMIQKLLDLYERKSKYLTVLLGEKGDPAYRVKLLERIAPVLMELGSCKKEADKTRLRYLMEYQSSGILSMLNKWFTEGKKIPAQQMVELLMSITVNGVQKEITQTLKIEKNV